MQVMEGSMAEGKPELSLEKKTKKKKTGVCWADVYWVRLACVVTEENELCIRTFCTKQKPDEKSGSGAILPDVDPNSETNCIVLAGYITLGDLAT